MAWRLAYSLETLRNQVNAAYPNRSKASDGTIGDAAHASVPSDHNPNSAEVVTALDLTHSPQTGFDAHALADRLLANRHPNLKYLISNGRIAGDWTGWAWRAYSGSNPHDKHIHVSVGRGDDGKSTQPYDDRINWNIGGNMAIPEGQINDNDDIAELWRLAFFRDPSTKEIADNQGLIGKYWSDASRYLRSTDAFKQVKAQYQAGASSQYETVTEQLFRKKNG